MTNFKLLAPKMSLIYFNNLSGKCEDLKDLHSYNSKWMLCRLFPKQRWRTPVNIQSQEPIDQENHVVSA